MFQDVYSGVKEQRAEPPPEIERGDTMRFVKGFFKKRKRQKITILSSLLIVYSVAAAGIFSYFHGSDRVTNKLSAESGTLILLENEWDSKGKKMAKFSEPGMIIPKDPRALNTTNTDLYIRLKMTISFANYSGNLTSGTDTDDGELGIPSNERRNKGVIGALRIDDERFIPNTEEELINWVCNNTDYVFVDEGQNLGSDELVFYFYYTAGEKNNGEDVMHLVKNGESTSKLFTALEIPVYKHDYLGIFDQIYSIDIKAEAVPAVNYKTAPRVDDIIADFNSN